jgi:hypothetical protein
MLIESRRRSDPRPRVSVTHPSSIYQVRIAFNTALVKRLAMEAWEYVAIDHDETKRCLTFILSKATYKRTDAHKLLREGGEKMTANRGRVLFAAKSAFSFLPAGVYFPTCRKGAFVLDYAARTLPPK